MKGQASERGQLSFYSGIETPRKARVGVRVIDILGEKEADQGKEERDMEREGSILLCQLCELCTAQKICLDNTGTEIALKDYFLQILRNQGLEKPNKLLRTVTTDQELEMNL